jgi:hypothetical protein
MVVAAKPPPPPNYHLARINQAPKRAIRSPGVFGDRGFIFCAFGATGGLDRLEIDLWAMNSASRYWFGDSRMAAGAP